MSSTLTATWLTLAVIGQTPVAELAAPEWLANTINGVVAADQVSGKYVLVAVAPTFPGPYDSRVERTLARLERDAVLVVKARGARPVVSAEVRKLLEALTPEEISRGPAKEQLQKVAPCDDILWVWYTREEGQETIRVQTQIGSMTRGSILNLPDPPGAAALSANSPEEVAEDVRAIAGDLDELPLVNRKILEFAIASIGKKLGNGQCTELALMALDRANAVTPRGYEWGRELAADEPPLPGDVVQFEEFRFKSFIIGSPRHTAIVVGTEGPVLALLHQNINNSPVIYWPISPSAAEGGTMKIYRARGR